LRGYKITTRSGRTLYVSNNEPFIVNKDSDLRLTADVDSKEAKLLVEDIIIGDSIVIKGLRCTVAQIQKVELP